MKKYYILISIQFLLGSCKNTPHHSDIMINMYGLYFIGMEIKNNYNINSAKFGSDIRNDYPTKTDYIYIMKSEIDTIGNIIIHYDRPFHDSSSVNNMNSEIFEEMCTSYVSDIGKNVIGDNLIVKNVICKKINSVESILIYYSGQHAILFQLFNNQRIFYEFNHFEDSTYLNSLINTITLTSN